jgi:hypothetical protein
MHSNNKFIKIDYNMFKKIALWGGGAMVKDLTLQCKGEKFKSPHSQHKLPWLFRWSNQVACIAKTIRPFSLNGLV